MIHQHKGRCQHCYHELVMCGDCAEQVCLRPRCPGGLCECDETETEAVSGTHCLFRFKGATPESLAQ